MAVGVGLFCSLALFLGGQNAAGTMYCLPQVVMACSEKEWESLEREFGLSVKKSFRESFEIAECRRKG